jgi:cytochrome c oxidase subunit 4
MEHAHKEHPKYMNIFWILLVLTVIEVVLAIPQYSQVIKAILLIGLACCKAVFVALYFMHLKFEKKTLMIIVLTPFIICVFLVFMLLPDLMTDARYAGAGKAESHAVDTSH